AHGHAQNLRPGLADRDAYAVAEPGDVAVFDAGGREVSCMGGLSTTVARRRGLAGVIVWGGVRDVATMRRFNYPVWSAYVTPRTLVTATRHRPCWEHPTSCRLARLRSVAGSLRIGASSLLLPAQRSSALFLDVEQPFIMPPTLPSGVASFHKQPFTKQPRPPA